MNTFKVHTDSPQQTIRQGKHLAHFLRPGDIVCLFGDLGSGKTTFVKGLAEGLRIKKARVVSPTFVLMNIYEGKLPLYHFDFYRLNEVSEIALLGYEEFLYGQGISVIEWAERFKDLMPRENVSIYFVHKGAHERELRFNAKGYRYKNIARQKF